MEKETFMDKQGIIILAAGNSSRLGQPKQLLPFRGSTLLSHVAGEAVRALLQPVVVVTGAYHEKISASLRVQPVTVVYNAGWQTGMGSGIGIGLAQVLAIAPDLRTVIVAVCDQPYISAELFRTLVSTSIGLRKRIVACHYAGIAGTPVLFDQKYFTALTALTGEAGAKQLLKQFPEDVATIPFPEGVIDIDTTGDVEKLS
jgi:molybdenum cofactor cytidylyltransferase